jgi:hypothetical protein
METVSERRCRVCGTSKPAADIRRRFRRLFMQWWLTVFFLVKDLWVPETRFDGWLPRAYPTESECLQRKDFAERACRDHPLPYEAVWTCSFGEPAQDVPEALSGMPC